VIGAPLTQTLTSTIYAIGVPPEINLVVKAVVVFAVMLLQSAEFRRQLRAIAVRAPRGGPR
jgi:galactofuranose transport system permease protein